LLNEHANNTLFIADFRGAENIASDRYTNVVLQVSSFNSAVVAAIKAFKSAQTYPAVTLLVNYCDILFGKKLLKAGCIDNYLLLPLSKPEFQSALADPLSPQRPPQNGTLEQQIRHLEPLAYTDSLTGLYNRCFADIFLQRLSKSIFGAELSLSLLLFDIDGLKNYNDTYGHPAGDKLLINTAEAMRKSFRPQDLIARIGGDEFAVILWDTPAESEVKTPSERRNSSHLIQTPENIAARFQTVMAAGKTTISGSMIHFTNNVSKLNDILDDADKKLYEAKRAGKNIILK